MRKRPGEEDSVCGACGAGWAEMMLGQFDPAAGQTSRQKHTEN